MNNSFKFTAVIMALAMAFNPVLGTSGAAIQPNQGDRIGLNDSESTTILYVTSSSGNGSYRAGQTLPILVVFSDKVTVTDGTPQLELTTGSPGTTLVPLSTGSGTDTLVFNYTVSPGDRSADLDVVSTASLDLNGATIVDTALHPVIPALPAPGGTGSLSANKDIVIDTIAPTASFDLRATSDSGISDSDNLTNATTLLFDGTLSETVGDFKAEDLENLGTAAGCTIELGSPVGLDYPLTVGSCSNGTVILSLKTGSISDAAGNLNARADGPVITVERTRPAALMSSLAPDPVRISPIGVTVTFDRSVNGLDSSDISATNAAVGGFTGSGATYSFNLIPSGQGLVRADIAAGAAQDDAGNDNTAGSFTRMYDSQGPTVSLASTASDPTRFTPIPFTATFSEPVTDFLLSDIGVTGGAAGNFSGSGTDYSFNVVPSGEGTVNVDIPTGAAHDSAGNGSSAASISRGYDPVAPSVSMSSTSTDPTRTFPIHVTATFSEPVTGFTQDDIVLTNASVANFGGSNATYSFDLTPLGQGSVSAGIPAGVAHDSAGNGNTVAPTFSRMYDSQAPTVTFDLLAASDTGISDTDNLTNASSLAFNADFSEDITGFTFIDLSNAGTAGGCTFAIGTPSENIYPVTASSCGSGTVIVRLAAASVTDTAGNTNVEINGPVVTVERSRPSVSMSSTTLDPTNVSLIPVTVTFSENVYLFTSGGIIPSNAAVSGFGGSGMNFSFDLVPAGQGSVSADIPAGAAEDAAGNYSTAAGTFSRLYDSQAPSVGMTSSASDPTRISPVHVTVTFSESVSGFTATDITTTNGSVTNFSGSGSGYTFDLYPLSQGQAGASIPAGAAFDASGNGNTAASFTRLYDSVAPTVVMASTSGPSTNTTPIPVTVTFSEPVTGFNSTDIQPANATVSDFSGSGDTYSFDLAPISQGSFGAVIAAGVAQDTAGNLNTTGASLSRTFDTVPPTVSLATTAGDPTSVSPIPVTVTFSEPVTGFIAGDIVPSNATISNFSGSGATYIFDLYPLGQGTVGAAVAAGVAFDAAGNGNTAAAVFSLAYDNSNPTVAMASSAADPTNTLPIHVTVTFSEPVTGFSSTDILATNGTVTNFSGANASYSFDLAVAAQGLVSADIPLGAAKDLAGNSNTAAPTFSRTYDSISPTVLMTSGAPDPTNTSPIPVTVTFSEAVSGFDSTDILPSNGSVGAFAGSGQTYTFTLAPSGQGLVSANIPAGAAQDAAGNGSIVAPAFSRAYDSVRPTAIITSTASSPTNISSIPITVTFSEAVTGFLASEVVPTHATVSGFSGSGTTYTFTISPTAQGTVSVDIPAGVAQDVAVNTNLAAATFSLTYDSVSPTVSMSSAVLNPTNASSIPVTVTFSESVTGFTSGDVLLTNATISSFGGSGTTYTFNLAPVAQGTVSADIAAGAAQDAAGNASSAAATFSRTFDSVKPAVTITSTAPDPTRTSPIPVTVTFSESVADFVSADITLSNATLGAFSGSGTTYTFNLIPSSQGLVTVDIAAGAAHDVAGNASTAATTFHHTYDSISPSVTLTSAASNPTRISPIPVTVTFTEAVADFVAADITPTNAAVNNFAGSGTTYTFNLAPAGQGTVSADIAAGAAHDAAGNGNIAATTFSRTFDSLAPTVLFSLQAGSDSGNSNSDNITNAATLVFNAAFSETISGFTSGDLSNTGSAGGCGFSVGSASSNVYPVTVSTCSGGTVILRLAALAVTDTAGNTNAQTDGPTVTVDRTAPAVVFDLESGSDSGVSDADNLTNADPLVFDAAFTEQVTGFTATDVTNYGTATGCVFSIGTPAVNTYPVTASSCGTGTVVFRLLASRVNDIAGNANILTYGPTVTIDRTGPVFSAVLPAAGAYINSISTASDVGYTLGEALANGAITITWTGGPADPTAHACTLVGAALNSGSHSLFDLTNTTDGCTSAQSLVSNAMYTFAFSGSDAAGNNASTVTNTGITFDNTPPTITIGAPSTLFTRTGPVTYTITYADTNFNSSSLAAGNITPTKTGTANGTIGVDSGTGAVRTVTISSTTGNGTYKINIAAGTASDLAGNLAPAAASATFTIDNAHPNISWASPVTNGGYYTVYNPIVHLGVSVSDNVGVYKVVYYHYDYIHDVNVEIGTVYNSPFSLDFDASSLLPSDNEIDAFVYDAAGNYYYNFIYLIHPPTLTVTKAGTGSGTVTSSPGSLNCGTTCSYGYDPNTPVTLTAVPGPDSTFGGWTGACTGMGPCVVTMSQDKSVTATFIYQYKAFLPFVTKN